MFVYCITNKINGKRYVGQAKNFENRWRQHKRTQNNASKRCPRLYNALKKYGVENFEAKVLIEVGSKEDLDYYEKKLIDLWNLTDDRFGYNISRGGDGVHRPCSEETKLKISRTLFERNKTIPSHNLGLKRSPETLKKLSIAHTGLKQSEETKRRRGVALAGNINSDPVRMLHGRWHLRRNTINPDCKFCKQNSTLESKE